MPLALLLAVDRTLGVDLCALLGICNNNNNGRQFPNQHQHHGTPEWVDFGGSGKLYYFGFDAGPMDWWEADRWLRQNAVTTASAKDCCLLYYYSQYMYFQN